MTVLMLVPDVKPPAKNRKALILDRSFLLG